ncbi:MAG: hypothetical protein WCR72_03440 [Bacteroidota bacterium]
MHYPGYDSGKVLLSEGQWYPFRIHNLMQLQDDAWYYVLVDINGLKHFMPASYYENYGFATGGLINCKIDRINCTGRIFLEPEHPFYKEGEIYLFDILGFADPSDPHILIVREMNGAGIDLPLSRKEIKQLETREKLSCLVKSIKKGKPVLEFHPIIY